MNFSSHDLFLAAGNFVSDATQRHPLGARGATRDGRIYRYVLAGATSLVPGNVIQSAAGVAGALTLAANTTTSTGIGSTQVALTCASSVAANFYADGYLMAVSGTGQGTGPYTIASHPAVSTGATGVFTLYYEDALVTAVTTSTTFNLIANKYKNVIAIPATTATGVVVGVCTYVITNAQYGWIQTWGVCNVLGTDTTAQGAMVYSPANSAGAISGFTATTLLTGQTVGKLIQADVAAQMVAIDLTISP